MRYAVALEGQQAVEFAECAGRAHPSDRMRLASFEARSGLVAGEARDASWREAELSGSLMVSKEARASRAGSEDG